MEDKCIHVEVGFSKVSGGYNNLTVIAHNFVYFDCKSDYVYRLGTLNKLISDEDFKWSDTGASGFSAYIDPYNRALQIKFINELGKVIYEKTNGIRAKIKNAYDIFDIPKDEYIGFTMDIIDKIEREKELIKYCFNNKIFGDYYTKEYDDGECIEVKLSRSEIYKIVTGVTYMRVEVLCDGFKSFYEYNADIELPFDDMKLKSL